MAIYKGINETTSIYDNGRYTQEVWNYVNNAWRMVYQAIRSCFGAGYWRGDKPWIGDEAWKG